MHRRPAKQAEREVEIYLRAWTAMKPGYYARIVGEGTEEPRDKPAAALPQAFLQSEDRCEREQSDHKEKGSAKHGKGKKPPALARDSYVSDEEQERQRGRNDQQPGNDGANKALAGPITKRARLGRICSAERITACEPNGAGEDQSSEDDEDPGNTRPNPRIGPIHSSGIGLPPPFRKRSGSAPRPITRPRSTCRSRRAACLQRFLRRLPR
jgi:hypothetical protein